MCHFIVPTCLVLGYSAGGKKGQNKENPLNLKKDFIYVQRHLIIEKIPTISNISVAFHFDPPPHCPAVNYSISALSNFLFQD